MNATWVHEKAAWLVTVDGRNYWLVWSLSHLDTIFPRGLPSISPTGAYYTEAAKGQLLAGAVGELIRSGRTRGIYETTDQ